MINLFIGLILLSAPFLLISFFPDKKRGFAYILLFLLLFQTILALLTQLLGIFYYQVIIFCTLVADIILLFLYFKTKRTGKFKLNFSFRLKNIDWVLLFVIIVSIASLYQVHYHYTGKISLATDRVVSYHEVKNMVYPYPYFSDEWYAVSLIKGAINNHYLPLKNTLNNKFFLNLELFFHSFLAQIMLIFGLDPLLQYTVLLIVFNTLIVLLIYLFLRINNVSKLSAGICSLLTLYITCGANLPGMWHLIPFNFGIIFFLLEIFFIEIRDIKSALLSTLLAALFYPPLIPFYFLGFALFLALTIKIPPQILSKIVPRVLLFLFFIILLIYASPVYPFLSGAVDYILSRIFFVSFVAPFIPRLLFYNIIPIPAIILAFWGLYVAIKNRKWVLLSVLILGAIFWFFYSFTTHRFFAEYERIAVFTSIIVVIISAFGLSYLEEYIKIKFKKEVNKIFKAAEVIGMLLFLVFLPTYTKTDRWLKLVSVYPKNQANFDYLVYPKSPANRYLTEDDLRIFKDIKGKKFLSIPWKGTVIGVATDNYPVLTKEGTISIGSNKILDDFLKANCEEKIRVAKKHRLDYIYIYKFDCPGFKEIDKSKEGLVLYKLEG